jgi:alcohol dehydrogenase YqhD (iron-dependent ADH family)
MNSFTLFNPTRLFFGSDQLAAFVKATAQIGKHALIVTGGGSVARLGYLQEISEALTAAGVRLSYFSGIEPNPESATINRATAYLREEKADFIIALGGGSVMDAAKAIAAIVHAGEPDIWPFVLGEPRAFKLAGAIPLAAIPTTAATASEVTPFAVISNRTTGGKSIIVADFLKPVVAWLNPAYTIDLPTTTTCDGAADILSHVFENYLLGGNDSPLADLYSEAVMATVLKFLPEVLAHPADEAARGRLLWASNLALNGYQRVGRHEAQFVLHSMEHALSAKMPELAHGRGLATLYPAYFRWLLANNRAVDRLARLGSVLFGLSSEDSHGFVEKFEQWLATNSLLQSLGDLGFSEADYRAIAEYTVKTYGDGKQLDALGPMTMDDIIAIFKATERQSTSQK